MINFPFHVITAKMHWSITLVFKCCAIFLDFRQKHYEEK